LTSSSKQIEPHGGKLVNRILEGAAQRVVIERAQTLSKVTLDQRGISDVEMIAIGGFSPLEGFMTHEDYQSVLERKRLKNGLPWTIPVTLAVSKKEADGLKVGGEVALNDEQGTLIGILELTDKFEQDKAKEALSVYKTDDSKHPGVNYVLNSGEVLLGGRVSVVNRPGHSDFQKYRIDPAKTRALFEEKGWRRIVGFQTRNPIHRAHEYIQKCALEVCDGLFLHPLVGATKADDIPASVRMKSYEVMFQYYYPKDRTAMAVLPAAMRYAGPREAIFHAIIRKNYGCTHFIVGRDHAGVGKYYGSFDAHHIFDEFDAGEIGITPLFFDYTFYCKQCDGMSSFKTCPHDATHRVSLSGTQVREMLNRGEYPPSEFTRSEVAKVLIESLVQK
jgi:sulfate adenylyltransferase